MHFNNMVCVSGGFSEPLLGPLAVILITQQQQVFRFFPPVHIANTQTIF